MKVEAGDYIIEMLASLSSISIVRKEHDIGCCQLGNNSDMDITPLKTAQVHGNNISGNSTTGTGFKKQFGSESVLSSTKDVDSSCSKLQWSNSEIYPMNRKPMFSQLKELTLNFKMEISQVDKHKSWFAVLYTHHKSQRALIRPDAEKD